MLHTPPLLFGSLDRQRELGARATGYVDRATTMLRRARSVVEDDRVNLVTLLNTRRDALATLLGGYQRFKHGCIFDPVIAHGTASSQIVARRMKTECWMMGHVFGEYHARWSRVDVAGQWKTYRGEMLDTADRLLGHIEIEHDAMTKLLTISGMYAAFA